MNFTAQGSLFTQLATWQFIHCKLAIALPSLRSELMMLLIHVPKQNSLFYVAHTLVYGSICLRACSKKNLFVFLLKPLVQKRFLEVVKIGFQGRSFDKPL